MGNQVATETAAILASGGYTSAGGRQVDLRAAIAAAVAGTRLVEPGDALAPGTAAAGPTAVTVTGESTLAAARRLAGDGGSAPACLNFASAKHPGGGWRGGARAQEESLARASALVPCLEAAPAFYAFHLAQHDPRYSDRAILSPSVPVFRDDHHTLLDEPYQVAFLTSAAPNAGAVRRNRPADEDGLPEVLARRARRVLDVAAAGGYRRLVLGAWGCGVFANVPAVVAGVFAAALAGDDRFEQVVFAVLDTRPGRSTLAAFEAALGA
jgi:uncharacterized protein (TIGR02452 family)